MVDPNAVPTLAEGGTTFPCGTTAVAVTVYVLSSELIIPIYMTSPAVGAIGFTTDPGLSLSA